MITLTARYDQHGYHRKLSSNTSTKLPASPEVTANGHDTQRKQEGDMIQKAHAWVHTTVEYDTCM